MVPKIVRLNLNCFQIRFSGWENLYIKCLFELGIAESSYSPIFCQNSRKSENFNSCHARKFFFVPIVYFVQEIFSGFWKTENIVLEMKLETNDLCRKQFCFWHWFLNFFIQILYSGSYRILVSALVDLEK